MKKNILYFIILSVFSPLYSAETVDDLLKDIKYKTDLSKKTKLANSGISFIYTRDDLQRMQAKYLKDILKSSYLSKYAENRYGIPDPLVKGIEKLPFRSSNIRIYVDNQEIVAGMYGSGLIIYGDLDIGFADHIEIYTSNPTYEYSTESTMILIKIYSKSTLKDSGAKVEVNTGSYGANRVSAFISQDINNDWSHFSYISRNHDNRKIHYSNNEPLSRDKDVTHIFSSFKNDNQRIILDITDQNRDSFMSVSLDATPQEARLDFQSLHIGYDSNFNNFSFLAAYDYTDTYTFFLDNIVQNQSEFNSNFQVFKQETNTKSEVFTTELKYNYITQNNKLTTGVKYRNKRYKNKIFEVNNFAWPQSKNDTQTVLTIFMENKYSIKENKILTFGIQSSQINNNYSEQDDNLFMYRLGYTYIYENFTSKTVMSHMESALEPYLISLSYLLTPGRKKPQEYDYLIQNTIFEKLNNKYELVLSYIKVKNELLREPSKNNLLDNYDKNLYLSTALFRWTYKYNRYDKLLTRFDYQDIKNLYDFTHLKNYTAVIRNINTYKQFDIFSELLYTKNNIDKKNFYDLSFGVKYNYNQEMTLSIKGENLLNKAATTTFTRVDPQTITQEEPLYISPIDRKITFTLEYQF